MSWSDKRVLLVASLGFVLLAILTFKLAVPSKLDQSSWSPTRIARAVKHPRQTYALWCMDHETMAVQKLIRKADMLLEANGDFFARIRPAGPNGEPVRAFGNGVLPEAVLLPTNTWRRDLVVVLIPEMWIIDDGTTNASHTGMEDFTLEVVTKIKGCGVRRVVAYTGSYGYCRRVFDGEVPSRKAIDELVNRGIAIGQTF